MSIMDEITRIKNAKAQMNQKMVDMGILASGNTALISEMGTKLGGMPVYTYSGLADSEVAIEEATWVLDMGYYKHTFNLSTPEADDALQEQISTLRNEKQALQNELNGLNEELEDIENQLAGI